MLLAVLVVPLVVLRPGRFAEHLLATSIRDPAEFLDVDVDERTRVVTLVTTDDLAGRAIHPREAIDPQPEKNSVDRRRWNTESVANATRAEFEFCAQLGDKGLDLGGGSMGAVPGPA